MGALTWTVAGASPYTVVTRAHEEGDTSDHYDWPVALRAVAGLQLVLARYDETHWILAFEADTIGAFLGDADYRSTGLVFHFGIFI